MNIFQYKDMSQNTFQNGEWNEIVVAEIQANSITESDKVFLEVMELKKIPTMIATAMLNEFSFDPSLQIIDPDAEMGIV